MKKTRTKILFYTLSILALLLITGVSHNPPTPSEIKEAPPLSASPASQEMRETPSLLQSLTPKGRPLSHTGEATINGEVFAFLWDPDTKESHMLSFKPNTQGNLLVSYQNQSGTALISQIERPFSPLGHPKEENLLAQKNYWSGYEKGYALCEPFGTMIPAQENSETGEISTEWMPLAAAEPLLKSLPRPIWDSLWTDPASRHKILQGMPKEEQEYWRGLTDGAQAALLGQDSEANLAQWVASLGEPTISSPRRVTSVAGQNFEYQLYTSQNATAFSAENLPPGLVLNPQTGLISGVPLLPPPTEHPSSEAIEVYEAILDASNDQGTSSTVLEISIFPPSTASTDSP